MRIAFDPEIDSHIALIDLKKFFTDSLKVCEMVEQFGVEEVREKITNSEIVLPDQPKITLKKIVLDIQKSIKHPEKLNKYLLKLLVHDHDVPKHMQYPDEKDNAAIYRFLCSCNQIIKKKQAATFCLSVEFGHYLQLYFENFQTLDEVKPWNVYIKEHFGVSESYSRRLRIISKVANQYPKLKKLCISTKEFLKIKNDILNMLKVEKYQVYWKSH